MNALAVLALSVASVTAIAIWVQGNRFVRRYGQVHRARPPAMWMFRKTDDPDLERPRRTALFLLPFFLVSVVVYLLRT
jgi:hypothetical protein